MQESLNEQEGAPVGTLGTVAPVGTVGPAAARDVGDGRARDDDLIADDVLVEDVSIDGMCGVY